MLDILNWSTVGRWLQTGAARPQPPLWRTVLLGQARNAEVYRRTLADAGIQVSGDADRLLARPGLRVAERKRPVELATVSPAELGFAHGARYDELRDRARKLRLGPCPAETGAALRLAYRDQPVGERLVVAMPPVGDPEDPLLFTVDCDEDGLWLDVHDGHADVLWRPDDRFVFVRRPPRWRF
ncbi:hypothetical protein [Rhodoplanes serenus]|uniref:hypothetical protein n=1 Tax=Rhodoplanes serenus TaxID=200615 RepID=UPI000DAB894B|nr:hypothetical protein [Rhodoplanes serenus]RAI36252.1 hypothetical protein CH340_03630 [Rhodoplanes serenus]